VPISFVQSIKDLNSGVIFEDQDFDDFSEEQVKDIAKKILFDNMLDDGSAMRITIPTELWLIIRGVSSYPTKIGHWIDKVDGTAGLSADAEGVGDILLDRGLTLSEINYTRKNVTLTLT